jgi:hypothetical protein
MCHTSQASPHPWFDHPSSLTYGDEYKSLRASLNNFRQPPVRFYFLVLHTFFSILSEMQLVSQRYLHYWKVFQSCNRCATGMWYTFKDMYLISKTYIALESCRTFFRFLMRCTLISVEPYVFFFPVFPVVPYENFRIFINSFTAQM